MQWFLAAIVIVLLGIIIAQKKNTKRDQFKTEMQENTKASSKPLLIEGAYQKNWLFSYNEKDAYRKLKPIAEGLGYTVFAKVRLLDLLEPIKGNPKYKTYFYKIQAKHVDFILCDQKLVARYIIELDDSSHTKEDRKQRDSFVDEALKSVGYKVLHVKAVTDDIRKEITDCNLEINS